MKPTPFSPNSQPAFQLEIEQAARQAMMQELSQWERLSRPSTSNARHRVRGLLLLLFASFFLLFTMGAQFEWVGHPFSRGPLVALMHPVQTPIPSREIMPTSALVTDWETAYHEYQGQAYADASEQLIELLAQLPKGETTNRCRLYLASSQLMLQHTGDAIPVLLQIELGSRYAYEARYLLGLAYWKKGNTEQSRRQWEALAEDRYAGAWQEKAVQGLQEMSKP